MYLPGCIQKISRTYNIRLLTAQAVLQRFVEGKLQTWCQAEAHMQWPHGCSTAAPVTNGKMKFKYCKVFVGVSYEKKRYAGE